jgi:glycosyltransferase involved in cell wall biosynthesis
MKSTPDVSVVMSVFNDAFALAETIQSILTQEAVAFELIAINDGSTDESGKILDQYAKRDNRVRVLHQENRGLTCSLIKGCELARGHLIARQDAGDVSKPTRLRLQKEFLDKNRDCSFVSCWTVMVGPAGEYLFTSKGNELPTYPVDILSEEEEWGLVDGPTHHGSVMFHKESYHSVGGYRSAFYFGQDWDLWYRLAETGKFGMIQQQLLEARISIGSISAAYRARQSEYALLSRKARKLRASGCSDNKVLQEAETLHPNRLRNVRGGDPAEAMYFIGKCLADNRDPRATHYLLNAVWSNPTLIRAWWWALVSIARHPFSVFYKAGAL